MPDLIRREDALDTIKQNAVRMTLEANAAYQHGIATGMVEAAKIVEAIPAVDAVDVVRCRDCMWFAHEKGELQEYYRITGCYRLRELGNDDPLLTSSNGFCSWGKRREDGDA